ncbi:hypothetical protein AA0616_2886 [Komagataeibacter nataicola NRIC 0616]|nr:hypothetical protein AA0616_2886 [Komagataeibacter nataicola NRIC 0616]
MPDDILSVWPIAERLDEGLMRAAGQGHDAGLRQFRPPYQDGFAFNGRTGRILQNVA